MVAKRSPDKGNENTALNQDQHPAKKTKTGSENKDTIVTEKKPKTETEKKVESLRILPDHTIEPNQDRLSLLSTSSHLCLPESTTPDLVLATKGG